LVVKRPKYAVVSICFLDRSINQSNDYQLPPTNLFSKMEKGYVAVGAELLLQHNPIKLMNCKQGVGCKERQSTESIIVLLLLLLSVLFLVILLKKERWN